MDQIKVIQIKIWKIKNEDSWIVNTDKIDLHLNLSKNNIILFSNYNKKRNFNGVSF